MLGEHSRLFDGEALLPARLHLARASLVIVRHGYREVPAMEGEAWGETRGIVGLGVEISDIGLMSVAHGKAATSQCGGMAARACRTGEVGVHH
jgi:hypothetical protein